MEEPVVRTAPYPAPSSKVLGTVNGIPTEVEVISFTDKIMVLISQGGRLAQWIEVPLSAPSAASVDAALPAGLRGSSGPDLLPSTHLTPKTLFGAGGQARETFGQLVAAQVGSLLALRDATDSRTVVVGLGLEPDQDVGQGGGGDSSQAQAIYFDIVELVQKVL
ncbi:hypothetical protein CMQ_1449 [Grosmannia clavigera kw1407]|uniref:Proteasome assembly chaperone 3 n=1 Tax=Grosmannia clavigera (strain kw1407 / UAMH 11150) TaxID=655863 RepID=F0XCZ5_GROCL|nr:uncharacterized protein CMQ_1449 [Grosmannia clavigera kw1407]EFX04521.1 hypothetical protein CMQ_1449 [Grosmannia clavigera kw1407]